MQRSAPSADSARRFLSALVAALLLSACGGGGSGSPPVGEVPPQTTPTPAPAPEPTPQSIARPQPTGAPAGFEILLREGAGSVPGLELAAIEEARFGSDGKVGVIASVAVLGRPRVLLVGGGDEGFESRLDMRDHDAADALRHLGELRSDGAGGWFAVAGEELSDRVLLRWTPGGAEVVSDTRGESAPFERLGAADAGAGRVAFVAGWPGCTLTDEGSDRCSLGVLRERADGEWEEVALEGTDLSFANPKSPHLLMAADGAIFLSLPGRGDEPMVARVDSAGIDVLMQINTELDGIGQLLRPELVQLNDAGVLILRATLVEDERPRLPVLVRWEEGDAEVVIRAENEGVAGEIATVGSIGIDDEGTLLYQVLLRVEDDTETLPRSLRRAGPSGTEVLITERMPFPDSEFTVLKIEDPFQNRHGEIAFVATLGTIEELPSGVTTTTVRESRVVRIGRDGAVRSVLSSQEVAGINEVGDLEILDFSDTEELLIGVADEGAGGVVVIRMPG